MSTLDKLGHKYGTDKASPTEQKPHFHGYLNIYERYFERFMDEPMTLLEIGIGYGASMKMWAEYFPSGLAFICGMDDFSEVKHKVWICGGPTIVEGDQSNRADLQRVVNTAGPFDIIIDDGGHTMEQQQTSLGFLFQQLRPGGLYVIEGLYTSRASGRRYNPTKAEWTTLRILEYMSREMPWESAFMVEDEVPYLDHHASKIHIEKGAHSEIAFIRKST